MSYFTRLGILNLLGLTVLSGNNTGDQDLSAYLTSNTPITPATKTKITYDADGLVTSGADASTADIADSLNKRYVTDAHLVILGNTSGTNTGDQTLPVKNTGAEIDTGIDDAKFATAKSIEDSSYIKAAYADAKVEDAIADGVTDKAPSQNKVFDALAMKADKDPSSVVSAADSILANKYRIVGGPYKVDAALTVDGRLILI